jgi:hypothetical protein
LATAIDNIFLDTSQPEDYNVTALLNGLSDHDAQLLTLKFYHSNNPRSKFRIARKINKNTIPSLLIN